MGKFNIIFYETKRNECPVLEWIQQLENKAHLKKERILLKKVYHLFELISELGPALKFPDNCKIQGVDNPTLWELRIQGSVDYRIFWTLWKENILILGYDEKKKKRYPQQHFEKYINMYIDWNNRHTILTKN